MIRSVSALIAVLSVALGSAGPGGAQERVERTGTRLGTDTTPRTVYRFSEPREIEQVLSLLEQGRTDAAVRLARDYLDSLGSTISADGLPVIVERYFALNALCVALTKAGRVDEAVATCSEAIGLFPSRWTAFNSRATAYYASRRFDRAAADYLRALEVAPDDESVRATLEHNIELTEQRLAEPDPRP